MKNLANSILNFSIADAEYAEELIDELNLIEYWDVVETAQSYLAEGVSNIDIVAIVRDTYLNEAETVFQDNFEISIKNDLGVILFSNYLDSQYDCLDKFREWVDAHQEEIDDCEDREKVLEIIDVIV